jgi:hypothetical protein
MNSAELEFFSPQPLSIDEVTVAVSRLGAGTLELPTPTAPISTHYPGDLPTMTAAQRFWLAFTGKPGSSGRAGPAYEPGLPRSTGDSDHGTALGVPRQRKGHAGSQ